MILIDFPVGSGRAREAGRVTSGDDRTCEPRLFPERPREATSIRTRSLRRLRLRRGGGRVVSRSFDRVAFVRVRLGVLGRLSR